MANKPAPAEDNEPLSKTRKKQQMQELQDLGEELAALSTDRLKKIDIPENLREALREAQRMSSHGAIRRQLQYVGKIMRDVDAEPIRAALAAIRGESAVFELQDEFSPTVISSPAEPGALFVVMPMRI